MFAPTLRYHSEDNMLSDFRFDICCAAPYDDRFRGSSDASRLFPDLTSFFGFLWDDPAFP